MKRSTKFLLAIFLLFGLIYSLFRLFTGQAGSSYYEFLDVLTYSSIVLFVFALIIILIDVRRLSTNISGIIFLLLATPLTISATKDLMYYLHYNRAPDLSAKYNIPVSRKQYLLDSVNFKIAIDSMHWENRMMDASFPMIDTILYSQRGDKVFVSYIKQIKNKWGYYYEPDYMASGKRDSAHWQLTNSKYSMNGSFDDIEEVKLEVRKFYFNQFTFLDKDSTTQNYFWSAVLQHYIVSGTGTQQNV